MTNKEVHELVNKAIENYARSTNTLFSTEIKNVRDDVQGLTREFKEMNGRVREVCEWKARVEGGEEALRERKEWSWKKVVFYSTLALGLSGIIVSIIFQL